MVKAVDSCQSFSTTIGHRSSSTWRKARLGRVNWNEQFLTILTNSIRILLTKGSPSYSRITTDGWYTLTKIHEWLWTERIPIYPILIFQVYVTYCVRLDHEYSRILWRHNHIFEFRILQNTLAFTQWHFHTHTFTSLFYIYTFILMQNSHLQF